MDNACLVWLILQTLSKCCDIYMHKVGFWVDVHVVPTLILIFAKHSCKQNGINLPDFTFFLATQVALHFNPASHSVGQWVVV